MPRRSLQLTLDLFEAPSPVTYGAREAASFTHWPTSAREIEMNRAVAAALASMLHLSDDRKAAERLPRLVETAVLASSAGPSGIDLLEQVDRALVEARGRNHGLLDGRYA